MPGNPSKVFSAHSVIRRALSPLLLRFLRPLLPFCSRGRSHLPSAFEPGPGFKSHPFDLSEAAERFFRVSTSLTSFFSLLASCNVATTDERRRRSIPVRSSRLTTNVPDFVLVVIRTKNK